MIDIYVSSIEKVGLEELSNILFSKRIECQIYENKSCLKKGIEKGYNIKIFNLDKLEFKEKVWNLLSQVLNVKCGYVISDDYKGCILNWPDVFTESKCANKLLF